MTSVMFSSMQSFLTSTVETRLPLVGKTRKNTEYREVLAQTYDPGSISTELGQQAAGISKYDGQQKYMIVVTIPTIHCYFQGVDLTPKKE